MLGAEIFAEWLGNAGIGWLRTMLNTQTQRESIVEFRTQYTARCDVPDSNKTQLGGPSESE